VTDPRVVAGLRVQLDSWRGALGGGAERVGWKIGLNIPEIQQRLGIGEAVIGHLTSATRVEDGGSFAAGGAGALHVEPEVGLEIGRDVDAAADADDAREAIAGVGAAVELVDTWRPPDTLEGIVAGNVFHRGFLLGPSRPAFPAEGVRATVAVNGEQRDAADSGSDFTQVVRLVARLLNDVGERLQAGDRIITGSVTAPVPVQPGDRVRVELGGLGGLEVRVA
jgi:2-keto-4-pentenoate hydratase